MDLQPNSDAVVVVGGGFAGLTTALQLSRKKNRPSIILIEPRDRFVFSPLLYEVLSGEIHFWEVAPTYQSLVGDRGIILIEEYVMRIDTQDQKVVTQSGLEIKYSKVVISTGSTPNYFGIPGALEHTLSFHNLGDVKLLRKQIKEFKKFQEMSNNLVVVGAGATGVELACKLSDLLKDKVQIHLVEMGPMVLPHGKSFNKEQSERALDKRKIRIHSQTKVTGITAHHVELQSLEDSKLLPFNLPCRVAIWTAGSRAVLPKIIPQPVLIQGKIPVDEYLNVIGFPNVLAVGDISFYQDISYPTTAQVAMQQGEVASINLAASLQGKNQKAFKFNDLGEMLSLGIGEASVTAFGLTMAGPLAFQLRRMAYLTKLPNISLTIRSASAWLLGATKK